MTDKEQIEAEEQIYKIVQAGMSYCKHLPIEECKKTYCNLCHAEALYKQGIRKVERGFWQLVGYGNNRVISWKCSVCNGEVFDASNGDTDFCPNCGADMRGGKEE